MSTVVDISLSATVTYYPENAAKNNYNALDPTDAFFRYSISIAQH